MRDDLSLLQAQLAYKKRLESMLKELRSQQEPLRQKVAKLEKTMRCEQKDVERLEGRSLAAFFYNVVGKKDEKLDAERREYYAARVKYDSAARELEAIEQDIASTEEDLQDLTDCETRYARALEEKRLAIEAAGTTGSEKLLENEHIMNVLQGQERELEEAITAGTTVLHTSSEVLSSLRNVESLSYLDRLGKNPLTDIARHETLDEAQKCIEQLQVHLQYFNKELSNVSIRESIRENIGWMLSFSDLFFDNLFADAAMPERIRLARTQVEQLLNRVLEILRQLQTKLEEVRYKHVKAKEEVDALILNIEV